METVVEQRKSSRTELSWPVSVWLPEAHRFYNGRSFNISKSGVFIKAPLMMPVREGQVVEINFPRTMELAKDKGQFARIKRGMVVRVERRNMLRDARVGVAVRFE